MDCEHEFDPIPTGVIYDDSPLPRTPPGLERIVPCKKCGAPLDRGRFTELIDNPYARISLGE